MEVKDFIEGVLITGGSWICAVVLIGLPIKTWSYKNKRKYQHYKIKLEKFEKSQRKDYSYPVYKYTDEWGQKQLFHDKKSLVHKETWTEACMLAKQKICLWIGKLVRELRCISSEVRLLP